MNLLQPLENYFLLSLFTHLHEVIQSDNRTQWYEEKRSCIGDDKQRSQYTKETSEKHVHSSVMFNRYIDAAMRDNKRG